MENENNINNGTAAENSSGKNTKLHPVLKVLSVIFLTLAVILFVIVWLVFVTPKLQEMLTGEKTRTTTNQELEKSADFRKQITQMKKEVDQLSKKYNNYTSGQSYIVINTTDNRFFLYKNKKLVREGFCSSGSYTLLQSATSKKQWIFKTPKGKYWIHGKTTNPVWIKPDWAFVEEGLPIPRKDDPSRYEYGVLGDYAMAIGDGYLIHGTIYKRFLGMPVTHGCVRLNDEDLEAVFNTLSVGSKVYIF